MTHFEQFLSQMAENSNFKILYVSFHWIKTIQSSLRQMSFSRQVLFETINLKFAGV